MKNTFTKLFLCATIGAIFNAPLHAQETDPVVLLDPASITVLLRATVSSLESRIDLPKNTHAALLELQQMAPQIALIYPVPLTYSQAEIAAMERHNLTRYYSIDTSGKSIDEIKGLMAELKNNPLVEFAQIAPAIVSPDREISVLPLAVSGKNSDVEKNGIPDHRSRQHYMQGLTPAAGVRIGGLNAIAARAYPGGFGENVRIISSEWNPWYYDHIDLPRPFLQHGETSNTPNHSHDTMSAGIMFSKDNGFGTTGFVPKAQAGFSQFSQPGGGSLFKLGQHLEPGDVVQVGIHFGPQGSIPEDVCQNRNRSTCYLPIESIRSVADEVAYLTHERGVHVIMAAGNGNINLDHPYFNGHYDRKLRDSGAIYAGAANPWQGDRAGYSEHGSRVDLFSWGYNVTTTDWSRSQPNGYTHEYNGTSSANPIIAGAVAQIQSIAFEAGLGAIPPKKMRQILVETGHPLPYPDLQRPIGMQPDIPAAVEKLLRDYSGGPLGASLTGPTTAITNAQIVLTAAALNNPENKPVSYEWIIPAGITVQRNGPTLRFTAPALAADQAFSFGVKVSAGTKTATANHVVTVQKQTIADAPQAIVGGAINVVATTSAGFAYKLDGSKSLNAASFKWKKLSGPFDLRNADRALAEAVVRTNSTGKSVYKLTVTNKNGVQASANVTVTAVTPNAVISGATSITQGQAVSLKAQANFANAPTYRWKVRDVNGGGEVLRGTQQQLSLSTLAAGNYQATVEVASTHGGRKATAQQTIVVEKKAENRPPVVVVSGPTQAEADASVTLNAEGSSAANGGKLRYSWKVSPQLPFSVHGAALSFTAPRHAADTVYKFTVVASDGTLTGQKEHFVLVKKSIQSGCGNIPQWESKAYKSGMEVQLNGRSYIAKWWAEPSHIPGTAGWIGDVWRDNGVCK